MAADATIMIRGTADADAPRSVECHLPKNATYHPWNDARTKRDNLLFVTFTKVQDYRVEKAHKASLERQADHATVTIRFKAGDRWSYLAYGSEGLFLMRFKDADYVANQDLAEASTLVSGSDEAPQEWLRLDCANGTSGWLFMNDVPQGGPFGEPNTPDYGRAEDAPPPAN
jgi:hypothetical protein